MRKFFMAAAVTLAQDDNVNFNDDPNSITINDDGVFEEDWDFVPSEVPLKPGEIFSCKDQFQRIEWDPQELSQPVLQIAAGTEKQIYALSRVKSESLSDGYPIVTYDP